eukprot:TRINITY_DN8021_c0_g1_i13.p1 TRINITY_DN8021_c0_g1~~TRINITY_DN8021_c0_g1_i13.p1  ORF type:complete len:285 (+),score=85.57 TRINITY_DN8021_c0_g1_i13:73-927(+)
MCIRDRYIAADIALCNQCSCLIPEEVSFVGWDTAAIIVKDSDLSTNECQLLEFDRWGFHTYDLLDRMRYYEKRSAELAIIPISREVTDENGMYKQLVKPFVEMSHKDAVKANSQITFRVFERIKAYAKQVDKNSKLYKEYKRKFRFFLQGREAIASDEVEVYLNLLVDEQLTEQMIAEFMQAYGPDLKAKETIDFDSLYSLMKRTILVYKAYYEIDLDSVISAEMLVQFLFALEVVRLPEYVESLNLLTCDMLLNLPDNVPDVNMIEPFTYEKLIKYYIYPRKN